MTYPEDPNKPPLTDMPGFIGAPIMDHKVHHVVTAPKKDKGGLVLKDIVVA